MRVILRGKRSTWRRCWMTSVAPRIVNGVVLEKICVVRSGTGVVLCSTE